MSNLPGTLYSRKLIAIGSENDETDNYMDLYSIACRLGYMHCLANPCKCTSPFYTNPMVLTPITPPPAFYK